MSKCLVCNIAKEIMEKMNVHYSYIHQNDFDTEMKDLVLNENHEESHLLFEEPFVYYFDYNDEEMSILTQKFKDFHLSPICAASTTHNLLWSFSDLIKEIMKEHLTFQTAKRLKELIMEIMKLPVNEDKEKIEKALMESFIILQGMDADKMLNQIKILEQFQKA